ncbi:MAG TPA: ribosome silencing factor [Anaerolineales bacterium]|nr:ribosome silencing factor [Anaerolineales bacterium]
MEIIEDRQGENILILDIQNISIIADYFVLASCDNERQLKAVARAIVDTSDIKRHLLLEGLDDQAASGWVLLDLGDIMVHLFTREQRDYYNLEELWRAAHTVVQVQ